MNAVRQQHVPDGPVRTVIVKLVMLVCLCLFFVFGSIVSPGKQREQAAQLHCPKTNPVVLSSNTYFSQKGTSVSQRRSLKN